MLMPRSATEAAVADGEHRPRFAYSTTKGASRKAAAPRFRVPSTTAAMMAASPGPQLSLRAISWHTRATGNASH